VTPESILRFWNDQRPALPAARMTSKRRAALRKRISEHSDAATWVDGIAKIALSDFCHGENGRGWNATLDFVALRRDKIQEAAEGKYDNRPFSLEELSAARSLRFRAYAGKCPHQPECEYDEDCLERVARRLRKDS
jgi:hypothetical protein